MGAVAVVVPQQVAHGDVDVVVVMEPPPIGELPAEAGVVALDDPVLPGAARVDGDGPTKGSGRYSTTLTLKLPKTFAFSISHTGATAWPRSATPMHPQATIPRPSDLLDNSTSVGLLVALSVISALRLRRKS